MEKSNKLMLGAALVVALLALAGVGYAAYADSHTAKTTTADSSLTTTYLTVTQDGGAKYGDILSKLYFNTETVPGDSPSDDPTIKYIPRYTHKLDTETSKYVAYTAEDAAADTRGYALISEDFQLVLTNKNVAVTTATLTVTTEDLTPITNMKYTMVLVESTASGISSTLSQEITSGTCSFNITLASDKAAGSITYNVYLFVSIDDSKTYVEDTTPSKIGSAGFADPATFEFVVTVADSA